VKVNRYLLISIRIFLIISVILEIYSGRWFALFITILTILLTYLPKMFEKKYRIDIPETLEIFILFFIFATLYLGEVHSFYFKFWWWDLVLHFCSAIALALVGFAILSGLYEKKRILSKPIWICVFAFCFALALGAAWEIFEFSIDQIFSSNMQKSGLVDTMTDLIIDSIGALIVSVAGFFYIKKGKIIHSLENFNKDL
jgi:hypothetical protein